MLEKENSIDDTSEPKLISVKHIMFNMTQSLNHLHALPSVTLKEIFKAGLKSSTFLITNHNASQPKYFG